VAGLLIFRLLYYIIPFALALLVLGGRELGLNAAARQRQKAAAAALSGAPPLTDGKVAAGETHDRGFRGP
jgi:hypothetical protein